VPTGSKSIAIPQPNWAPLRCFLAHGVEFLIIGGHAVAFHGYPRNTDDLDIWVSSDIANLQKLERALLALGYNPDQARSLYGDQAVLEMGVRPFAIQILKAISGVDYRDAAPRGLSCTVVDTDMTVRLIHLADLRRNKAASRRGKDLLDLENLPLTD
jgi:hypothetical protein